MVALSPIGGAGWQFFDANGDPLSGGKLFTYAAGTTTPLATYTDYVGATPNTNPIVLDSAGRVSGEIWLTSSEDYKFVLTTATNVTLWTKDNIPGMFAANSSLDAADIPYNQGGAGAVNRTVAARLRDYVSVKDFGAVGNGVTDDTVAINNAAAFCRSSGAALCLPTVATFYAVSDTIDFSNIKVIEGAGAQIRGTFNGKPGVIIGGTAPNFRAKIHIEVRNNPDRSSVAGTHGIKILNFSESHVTVYARGFFNGLYFDGASGANRVWVGNRFYVLDLYNNVNHVNFDMAGNSYAIKNQIIGGGYYLGTNVQVPNSGTFNVSLSGGSSVADLLVQSPEIGVDRGSVDISTYAAFVYANISTSINTNTIEFVDTRIEQYGSWASAMPYGVNIAANTSGRIGVSVEFSGSVASEGSNSYAVYTPQLTANRIRLATKNIRAQGNVISYPQTIIPSDIVPYQTVNRCYVPGRVIYDAATGYNVPADYFSSGFGSNSASRANGDGDIVSGSTVNSYGLIYTKLVGTSTFLQLYTSQQCAVICYDANGNILSGSSPLYVVGDSFRTVTRGAIDMYEFLGFWVWIHPSVASFYIGAARWASNGKLEDIKFDVLYGSPVVKLNATKMSACDNVAHTLPNQAFMPLGSEMTGTASNGWRNTFYARTTTTAIALSGVSAVVVADATGITAGDTIGIELDTEISAGLRRYQYTTVSSVVGTTLNIGAPLSANVDVNRTILINRWVVK